ncbi:putative bifunctional diguanylate cyclase/phosphodiesterase [Azospirillum griseum]|uniref:Sensor domain-containing phosphodiesterase n=1 Tax=Azospirillum griseum TaxID=2496639 RepID=A0A431VEB6_9PROT|nr:bifunctional diguanylate cyclase/phosphodiesterase [Azospirillum griseum]RTR17571.1 sensor domain-containing phosphodiesterase [Azospirillum griseum]
MSIPLLRSLTLKQAIHAVLAAFVIGFAITAVEFGWTVTRERAAALDRMAEVATLMDGAATTAAWSLDHNLAEQVMSGVMGVRTVGWADIVLDNGLVFIRRERAGEPNHILQRLAITLLFVDRPQIDHALLMPNGDDASRRVFAHLRIGIDPTAVADRFLEYAATTLAAGVLRNLLIGLTMALVFHRLLTRPLVRIGYAVARIEPGKPQNQPLTVPRGHDDDELGFLVSRFNDTLEMLEREHTELRRLVTRCTLTGLANRTLLIDRLGHAIDMANRTQGRLAVLHVDLDRFKRVNESLGHDIGDALLIQTGERLSDGVRRCDTVGRLGGDEFLVILERVAGSDEAAMVAGRLLGALRRLTNVDGHRVHITASVGIALYPTDGTDEHALMRMADAAMQAAKADGGDGFVFYTREMTERAMARLRLEASLRAATERRDFELAYQPKIDAATGALTGFEALLRWRLDGMPVSPMEFIPVAEDTGLILDIGAWVLEEACRTASRWALDHGPLPIAVNVSARQLADSSFADLVESTLRRNGTAPELLEIEITETVIMKNVLHHLPTLNRLRGLGVRIAIDDFGTGYSSLAYLRQLPVDVLKIDRSFVTDLPHAPDIASTVIALAQRLKLSTVAEGVETLEQRRWLAEAGCDRLQGYLISRPVSADAAEAMVMAAFARQDMALTG